MGSSLLPFFHDSHHLLQIHRLHCLRLHCTIHWEAYRAGGVSPEREMSSSYLAAELPQRLASWPLSRTQTMIWINRTRSHWFNLSFVPTFPSLSFSIQSVPVLLPWVSVSIYMSVQVLLPSAAAAAAAFNPLLPFDNNSWTGPNFPVLGFLFTCLFSHAAGISQNVRKVD